MEILKVIITTLCAIMVHMVVVVWRSDSKYRERLGHWNIVINAAIAVAFAVGVWCLLNLR